MARGEQRFGRHLGRHGRWRFGEYPVQRGLTRAGPQRLLPHCLGLCAGGSGAVDDLSLGDLVGSVHPLEPCALPPCAPQTQQCGPTFFAQLQKTLARLRGQNLAVGHHAVLGHWGDAADHDSRVGPGGAGTEFE